MACSIDDANLRGLTRHRRVSSSQTKSAFVRRYSSCLFQGADYNDWKEEDLWNRSDRISENSNNPTVPTPTCCTGIWTSLTSRTHWTYTCSCHDVFQSIPGTDRRFRFELSVWEAKEEYHSKCPPKATLIFTLGWWICPWYTERALARWRYPWM